MLFCFLFPFCFLKKTENQTSKNIIKHSNNNLRKMSEGRNAEWKKVVKESGEGKWLRLYDAVYPDAVTRVPRTYECVERVGARCPDGVDVIALLRARSPAAARDPQVVLIRQYRPPVNATVLEFPAGLVEPGEDALDAGLRELAEETGFVAARATARVWDASPLLHADPSITSDSTVVYVVDVDADAEPNLEANRTQHLEENEHIAVLTVPLSQLWDTCRSAAAQGCVVDAKVYMFAMGLHLASSLL